MPQLLDPDTNLSTNQLSSILRNYKICRFPDSHKSWQSQWIMHQESVRNPNINVIIVKMDTDRLFIPNEWLQNPWNSSDTGLSVLLYHQPALSPWYSYRLIINSSLPIGCQFICETKLTVKSHKMILRKSWWSFLVVAIVIAVVIAVVIVNVWSSPNLPICFHFPCFSHDLRQSLAHSSGPLLLHLIQRSTHPPCTAEVSWSGASIAKKKRRRRR